MLGKIEIFHTWTKTLLSSGALVNVDVDVDFDVDVDVDSCNDYGNGNDYGHGNGDGNIFKFPKYLGKKLWKPKM